MAHKWHVGPCSPNWSSSTGIEADEELVDELDETYRHAMIPVVDSAKRVLSHPLPSFPSMNYVHMVDHIAEIRLSLKCKI